jgi:ABC-type transporter Mla MlaB component
MKNICVYQSIATVDAAAMQLILAFINQQQRHNKSTATAQLVPCGYHTALDFSNICHGNKMPDGAAAVHRHRG